MIELESDPEVVRFTPMGLPLTRERTEARLREQIAKQAERAPLGIWLAETKAGDFVGWFMLLKTNATDPELGFMLARRQWDKGYATEAAKRLVELGLYELGHSVILATVRRENVASAKILENLGFERTVSKQEKDTNGIGEVTLDHFIFWT